MEDVREYLHLYLGCECTMLDGDLQERRFKLNAYNLNYYRQWISDIRPILRNLNSMTKNELKERDSIVNNFRHSRFISQAYEVKYLLSKGFWLFGDEAFDKGLIIDSKTLNKEV